VEENFRTRGNRKRLIKRWLAKFEKRPYHEQQAIYAALSIVWWGRHGLEDVTASPSPHINERHHHGTAQD
jgi:hypothetical protein